MRGGRDPHRKGGLHDDVAQNIHNEQQADAAPSADEIEAERHRAIRQHAEWKAIEHLIGRGDLPMRGEVAVTMAEAFDFRALASVSPGSFKDRHGPGFITDHKESWQIPEPSEVGGYRVPGHRLGGFDERFDRRAIRKEKRLTFGRLQQTDLSELAVATKIVNPCAGKTAVVVRLYDGISTNDIWEKTARMSESDYYQDRFDDEAIAKYEQAMAELVREVMPDDEIGSLEDLLEGER